MLFGCLAAMHIGHLGMLCPHYFPYTDILEGELLKVFCPPDFFKLKCLLKKIKTKLTKRKLSPPFTYFTFHMFVTTVMGILSIL